MRETNATKDFRCRTVLFLTESTSNVIAEKRVNIIILYIYFCSNIQLRVMCLILCDH